jgi:hypothetical protein
MNLSEVTYPRDTKKRVQSLLVQEANRTSNPSRNWFKPAGNRVKPITPLDADSGHHAPSQPRRFVRRTVLISVAAGVLAGALVASDVANFGGITVPATAQAAELLNRAADATIATPDPAAGPGQYLKLDITQATALSGDSDGETIAWISHAVTELYVPYDRSGEWIMNVGPLEPREYIGSATKEKVRDYYASIGLPEATEPGQALRSAGGTFLVAANTPSFGNLSPTEEATIPREPAALVEWIRAKIHGSDNSVWSFIAGQLATGVVPAKWRAALYQAAAIVPGATVIDQQATLDGRLGTAVGRTEDGVRTDVIIDAQSGQFIGMRAVNMTGYGLIPTGTTTAWTAVRTSISNSAP